MIRRTYGTPRIACQTSAWREVVANPDQHLIVPDTRLIDLAQLQHVGRAIPVLDDRLHRVHSPLFAKRSNRQSLQAARALEKTSRRRACRSLNPPTATLKSIMER